MKLITWNIQWCLGVDGRVDPERIVSHAKSMGDFDVLCLQEVARNYPGLKANDRTDQFAELASLLPGYTPIEAIAVDTEHAQRGFHCRLRVAIAENGEPDGQAADRH